MSDSNDLVRIADVAKDLGLSPSRIRQLADADVIPSSRTSGGHRLFDLAAVRAAIGRRSLTSVAGGSGGRLGHPTWQRELTLVGLAEHEVWRRLVADLSLDISSNAGRISAYGFMGMLNNAIDHSDGHQVVVTAWVNPEAWQFEIRDDGVGAFTRLRTGLHLGSEFESVQELSKGNRTTNPERHTGEGIFFTSKVMDIFQVTSTGVRWTVDNIRGDVALGTVPVTEGTIVSCQIDPNTDRELRSVFLEFTRDDAFVRTRPVVTLFEIGTTFVSRSEARRLLDGLERDFEIVEVDFAGVEDVGQGFVDELLRVWPNANPGHQVVPINMNAAVEFMVRRGLARRDNGR